MSPERAAGIFHSIYRNMFIYEDPFTLLPNLNMGGRTIALPRSLTRESWAASIVAVKANVDTDWAATMERLQELVYNDTSSPLTANYRQDLSVYLHLHGLCSATPLKTPLSAQSFVSADCGGDPAAALPGLTSMPSVVCLTMRVHRSKLSPLMEEGQRCTPTIVGVVESNTSSLLDPNGCQNMHSLVQAGFGEIMAPKTGVTTEVKVTRDFAGWSGSSPLLVSFLVPTWQLLRDPNTVRVKLSIASTLLAPIFTKTLGIDMCIHRMSLADKEDI